MPGKPKAVIALMGAMSVLAGCAMAPMGPTVQVMPGRGKSFDAFQQDLGGCKTFAGQQVQGQAEALNQRAAAGVVGATALSAIIGGVAGRGGGAAIGGAAGGLASGAIAGDVTAQAQVGIQQQYDVAFSQCMYAHGDLVPGFEPPPSYAGTYSRGAPDPLVRSIQGELIRLSYLRSGADGYMGPATAGAIRSFERSNGMAVDGAASGRVLAALQSSTVSASSASPSAPVSHSTPWVNPVSPVSASASPAMVQPVQPAQ